MFFKDFFFNKASRPSVSSARGCVETICKEEVQKPNVYISQSDSGHEQYQKDHENETAVVGRGELSEKRTRPPTAAVSCGLLALDAFLCRVRKRLLLVDLWCHMRVLWYITFRL